MGCYLRGVQGDTLEIDLSKREYINKVKEHYYVKEGIDDLIRNEAHVYEVL